MCSFSEDDLSTFHLRGLKKTKNSSKADASSPMKPIYVI